MNLEPVTYSEVSQKKKSKYHLSLSLSLSLYIYIYIYIYIYMESRKMILMNLFAGQG